MNRYIEKLNAMLAEQPLKCDGTDADFVLDMLYFYYMDANPVDSAVVRCQFHELDKVLPNRVFLLSVGLCVSHAREAFSEGVKVGMRLFTELKKGDDSAS